MTQNPRPGSYVQRDKLTHCKRCGCQNLVWFKSTKTQRWYLATTRVSQSDVKDTRYVCPWAAHRCADHISYMNAMLQRMAAERARDEMMVAFWAHDTHTEYVPACPNCNLGNISAWLVEREAELFTPYSWTEPS